MRQPKLLDYSLLVLLALIWASAFSLGVYNTKDDLDKLNEGINNCKKIFDLK